MSTYLVTGGAGFIGSHLVDALLAGGHRVRVLDDCSTGRMENLAGVLDHPGLSFLHGSVCDALLVDEACQGADGVFHLAAAVGVRRILERRVRSLVTNVRGTETVLLAAAAAGGLPVFLASSSEVYGKSSQQRFQEDDDCVLGSTGLHRWSYACAKALDEFLALALAKERRLPVIIGRFFNVTGPRQTGAYGMVLPRFCAAARTGRPLEVHGDGRQTRSFLHVSDAVAAMLALWPIPANRGKVFNIGGEEEIAIGDLAARVVAQAGSSSPVQLIPYQEAFPGGDFEDLRRRVPDTSRLRTATGWRPTRNLDRIIHDCLETMP